MSTVIPYNIQINTNAFQLFTAIENGFERVLKSTEKVTKAFEDCFKPFSSLDSTINRVNELEKGLKKTTIPSRELNTHIKTFGIEASKNVDTYRQSLTLLEEQISKSTKAIKIMDQTANGLSAKIAGDMIVVQNAMTTPIKQSVDITSPVANPMPPTTLPVVALPQIAPPQEDTNSLVDLITTIGDISDAIGSIIDLSEKFRTQFGDAIAYITDLSKKFRALFKVSTKEVTQEITTIFVNFRQFSNGSSQGILILSRTFTQMTTGVRLVTTSTRIFGIALKGLGIGLIVAAVVGLLYGLKYLYENSRKFREILGYIGGVGKAVFHNIGVFVERLWNMVLKPVATFIFKIYSTIFLGIWETAKWIFQSIGDTIYFVWDSVIKPVATFIFDIYYSIFMGIWETVKWVFSSIIDFAVGVWDWIKTTFSGFATWIQENIINPISEAFSGVWEWIVGLFEGIVNKLSDWFAPVKKFFKELFSAEGTVSINATAEKGAKDAGKAFDNEKKANNTNTNTNTNTNFSGGVGSGTPPPLKTTTTPKTPKTPSIGASAAQTNRTNVSKGNTSNNSNLKTLNVNKLVENINIYNQNGNTMSKECITKLVKEALITAVTDFALVE